MAVNHDPVLLGKVQNWPKRVVNADSTNAVTLIPSTTDGALVNTICVTSDDTVARTFQLIIHDGTNDDVVGEFTVPAGAGTGTTVPVRLLDHTLFPWLDRSGYLLLSAGKSLKVRAKVAVTAAKIVYFYATGGEYTA